ncbi:MAG: PEP-CTERM sorting domain-containing protein [Sedimentisphaerales bacterium]
MKNTSFRLVILAAAIIFIHNLVFTSPANGFVYWDEPNGSNAFFKWENGGSNSGLYGNPNIIGNTFSFSSITNFEADSSENPEVSDTLVFDLTANSGYLITAIQISEGGDYDIVGDGSVNVLGELTIHNLASSESDKVASLNFNPPMPVYSGHGNDANEWSGSATITGLNWTHIKITLSNDLFAIADEGSASLIWKKSAGMPLTIQIVPEPATIAILSIGLLALIKRKNKQ